jgi:hypothetical protein
LVEFDMPEDGLQHPQPSLQDTPSDDGSWLITHFFIKCSCWEQGNMLPRKCIVEHLSCVATGKQVRPTSVSKSWNSVHYNGRIQMSPF